MPPGGLPVSEKCGSISACFLPEQLCSPICLTRFRSRLGGKWVAPVGWHWQPNCVEKRGDGNVTPSVPSIRRGRKSASIASWPESTCVDTPDLFGLFVRPLHRSGVRYMVSGSLASVFYGEPRLTLDVDIVVHLGETEVAALPGLFPEEHYYLPPAEVVNAEVARATRGHFNVIHFATGQKADSLAPESLLGLGV